MNNVKYTKYWLVILIPIILFSIANIPFNYSTEIQNNSITKLGSRKINAEFFSNKLLNNKYQEIENNHNRKYNLLKQSDNRYSHNILRDNNADSDYFSFYLPPLNTFITSNNYNIINSDPIYATLLNVVDLWNLGYNGSGVTVAVVDTGVNSNHPALINKVVDAKSFVLQKYGYNTDESADDMYGHGTAVASLIAGNDSQNSFRGTAYDAKIVSAKVASSTGLITSAGLVAAIEWVASREDVDVINLSLSEPEEGYSYDILEQAVANAVANGKIVVCSAGNNGESSTTNDYFTIGSPGSSPQVITVGATDNSKNIAYFSSNGPTYAYQFKPDVVAPGINVPVASYTGGYKSMSGTSFSAPLIAGVAATLISAARIEQKESNVGMIKSAIIKGAQDLGLPWYRQGAGFVDAGEAWNYITNNLEGHVALPYNIPDTFRAELPAGETLNIPITAISSIKGIWDIRNISGNANFVSMIGGDSQNYTQIYNLIINPSRELSPGYYNSLIYLNTPGGNYDIINLNLNILPPAKCRLLLDLVHTPWDSYFKSGSGGILERLYRPDISYFANILRDEGCWIDEFTHGTITDQLLSNYDAIWIPSAFTITSPGYYDHPESRSTKLLTSELMALYNFKANGGSFIIDFGGVTSLDTLFESTRTDEESISALAGLFDIIVNDQDDTSITTAAITNNSYVLPPGNTVAGHSSLQNGIITTETNISSSLMKYGSSRVFISNTRNWRDQQRVQSVSTGRLFAISIAKWLTHRDFIDSVKIIREDNKNSFTYSVYLNSSLDPQQLQYQFYVNNSRIEPKINIHNNAIDFTFSDINYGVMDIYLEEADYYIHSTEIIYNHKFELTTTDQSITTTISRTDYENIINSYGSIQWEFNIDPNYNIIPMSLNITSNTEFKYQLNNNILSVSVENENNNSELYFNIKVIANGELQENTVNINIVDNNTYNSQSSTEENTPIEIHNFLISLILVPIITRFYSKSKK